MAYMQLAQPYQSGQNANPFGAFVAGEQQAQQLQLDKQRQQANQLALLQAQQQADQANQLDQLAPSIYTTTDPTQRAQLQSQLAGLGGAGRAEAGAAGQAWSAQSAAQQARLLQGATQAAQLAFSAQSVQDQAQQAMILAQARQAIAASGADPKAVASLEAMDPQTQMRVIENGAMTIKQLAAQNAGPDLSKPIDVFASDGSTHQMVNVNGRLVPISQYIGQGQNPATNALDANGAATPALVGAVKHVESNGNPNAVSPAGAVGVMQVMPATASSIGFPNADLRNPQVNEQIGTQYLNQQIQKYHDPSLALAAYNAGPGTVDRLIAQFGNSYAAIAPHLPQETQAYVPKVLGQLNAGPTPATALNAPAPASPAQQGVQAALGHALQTMAQPVGQQQPQAQQPPTGQPAQPTTPEQQVQVNMKLLALQQQNGIMTLPQIMRATNASPQLAQAVTALSGLNPTVGLDMNDPVILNRIGMAMTKAAQQAPHLMPANVASVAQAAPQPVAQPVAPAPAAPPVPQAPVQFGVKPAAAPTNGAFTTMTPAQLKASNLPPDTVAQVGPNGEIHVIQKGAAGFQGGEVSMPGDPTKTGAAYMATLDPAVRTIVAGLLDGTKPWPSGTVLKNPLWAQAVVAAQQADPGFNAATYQQRAKARNAFTNGKQGDMLRQLGSISMHASQYTDDVLDLDNGNFTPFNKARNAVGNAFGAKAPGNVDTDALAVSEEVSKFLTGGVPAVSTINEWKSQLDSNASRGQQLSRISRIIGIVGGQLTSLVQQYKNAMGPVSQPLGAVNRDAAAAFKNLVDTANKFHITLPPHVVGLQNELSVPTDTRNPVNVPSAPQAAPQSAAGPIAVNPQTGERMQLVNGQWVKF